PLMKVLILLALMTRRPHANTLGGPRTRAQVREPDRGRAPGWPRAVFRPSFPAPSDAARLDAVRSRGAGWHDPDRGELRIHAQGASGLRRSRQVLPPVRSRGC